MGFFKSRLETRSISKNDLGFLQALGMSGNEDDLGEITYFTCMRILTDTVSKLPLKLYEETDDGTNKATNHYIYHLLKLRPNEYMSSSDFWKAVEFSRLHYGHSVVYIDVNKKNGKIKGLYPLDMAKVEIVVDDRGIIGKKNAIYYIYSPGGKGNKEYKFKSHQVLHFKGLTKDGIQGVSVRDTLKAKLEASKNGAKFIENYFKNGLFAKGVIQYTGDLSQKASKKLQQRFMDMAGGIKNAGQVLPLPLGFQFQQLNSSMVDSQFLELNQLSSLQIASAFGIKPHQINNLERSTHSNVEHQQREFYIETLQAILVMYEQELTYKLLLDHEINSGYFFRFNVDSILRSDLETRYNSYKTAITAGFMTPNEARGMEDLPSHEDGDVLLANGSYVSLKNVGIAYSKYMSDNKNTEGKEGEEGDLDD